MTIETRTRYGFIHRELLGVLIFMAGFGSPCLSAAEELPATARPVEGLTLPNIEVLQDENLLYFVLPAEKQPAAIHFPRLANVVLSVHLLGEKNSNMQIRPEPLEWAIELPQRPENSSTVVVLELDTPVTLFSESTVVHADSDTQTVLLPAKFATTHGSKLRFEPQRHKNTVGYWTDEKDTAAWAFQYQLPGVYDVDILQGCGSGHGGSSVELKIGGESLGFTVEETGHFQNFIWRTVGSVTLGPGEVGKEISLQLVPQKKLAGAVMDVRAVRLCPKGSKRSFEPELADPGSLPPKQN